MNYRHMAKQKTLAFGVYPDTGLAEARDKRSAPFRGIANDWTKYHRFAQGNPNRARAR